MGRAEVDDGAEGVLLQGRRAGGRARVRRLLARRLPALRWARGYTGGAALADGVAGLSLGLTMVPQSLAYAALAALPAQHGLYAALAGSLVYAVLGTVAEVSLGPSSLMALLTLQACGGRAELAALLALAAGLLVLLMALLRLGCLVDLISPAVCSGFTSATAVLIVVSQLAGALGVKLSASAAASVAGTVRALLRATPRAADAGLAAAAALLLLLLRKLKDVRSCGERAARVFWLISIGRNVIVVLAAAGIAYGTYDPDHLVFVMSGRSVGGLPSLSPLLLANSSQPLGARLRQLGPTLLVLPAVMLLANIAIAKAFSGGARVDAAQEMVALGAANVFGAALGAMPAAGAFTRSALAHAAHVRSPAAHLVSGFITLLALIFLTPYFYFIPKACLSAVLICAVIFMIDVRTVVVLWRSDRAELLVLLTTFCVSLAVGVEWGLLAGAAAAAALGALRLLARATAPPRLLQVGEEYVVVARLPPVMLYVSAERTLRAAVRATLRDTRAKALLLDCSRLWMIDFSARQALEHASSQLTARGRRLVPYAASADGLAALAGRPRLEQRALYADTALAALAALAALQGEDHAALATDHHAAPATDHHASLATDHHAAPATASDPSLNC